MRWHEANPRRRPRSREERPAILVYCGALRTERDYFTGLKRALGRTAVTVEVRGDGKSPKQLMRRAAEFRDQRPGKFTEVWCVVDVDEFDIAAAIAEATRERIHMAVSNPCFELWLLLHHADCRAHCAGYSEVAARLKKYVPTYDKSRLDFTVYAAGVSDAIKRARDLAPPPGEPLRNPSTSVWRLVETIMENAS